MTNENNEDKALAIMQDINSATDTASTQADVLLTIFNAMNSMPHEFIDPVHSTAFLQASADARQLYDQLKCILGWMITHDQFRISKARKDHPAQP